MHLSLSLSIYIYIYNTQTCTSTNIHTQSIGRIKLGSASSTCSRPFALSRKRQESLPVGKSNRNLEL